MSAADECELLAAYRLEPQPAVAPWLRANISLPPLMAPRSPGPFSTAGRPYMVPILETWNPESGVNHCTVAGGTQILKTTVAVLGVCYRIKYSPLPILMMGPSQDWADLELSEKRLHPLIRENAALVCEMPANLDEFRKSSMNMTGCPVRVVGSNSPTALAGGSYGILVIDEGSKIVSKGSEESPEDHPYRLALQRTTDFEELAFHYDSSTPTVSTHPFWQRYEAGDQTHFWVRCPHCREWFPFDLVGTKDDREEYAALLGKPVDSEYKSLVWSPDARNSHGLWVEDKVNASTRYICPHNGCVITEESKLPMIEGSREQRHNTEAPRNKKSFHVNSFLSPRITFSRIAWTFLSSAQDFFGLQTLYNSWLARPYELIKRQIKAETILKLKGAHRRGALPSRPALLVLTADPGEAQTHWMVTAIMPDASLIVIDWGTVLSIRDLIGREFLRSLSYPLANSELQFHPILAYCDSGYLPNEVYDMCAASGQFWWPTKGSPTRTGSWSRTTVRSHPGLEMYAYTDHTIKCDLWDHRIGRGMGAPVVLPADAEIIQPQDAKGLVPGLTGQKLITVNGTEQWKKLAHDHFADVLKLALLATWIAREFLIQQGASAHQLPAAAE